MPHFMAALIVVHSDWLAEMAANPLTRDVASAVLVSLSETPLPVAFLVGIAGSALATRAHQAWQGRQS